MARPVIVLFFCVLSAIFWMRSHGSTFQVVTPTTDYVADLYRPSIGNTGYLDLSPLPLTSSVHTFEIRIYPRTQTQCILSMGDPGTENFFAIQAESGAIVVRVGSPNLPNFVKTTSTTNPVLANTWSTISVTVRSLNNTNAQVSAFVNGVLVIDNAITRQFPSGTRQKVLIGNCQTNNSFPQPQGPSSFNGIVDNFRVWNTARTAQEIQYVITSVDTNVNLTSITNNPNLIAFYPLAEGRGVTSRDFASGSSSVATFKDAVWSVKDLGDTYRVCQSESYNVTVTIPSQPQTDYAVQNLVGQWEQSSCGPNFIVRVYRAPVAPWNLTSGCDVTLSCGPTTINAFTVKAFDEVFYIDTERNLFIRPITSTIFTSTATGSSTRPSGVRYILQNNLFILEAPTAGYMQADLIALARGGTEKIMTIYHTKVCEPLVTGLCKLADKRVSWNSFQFANEAWCGDQYVSGSEQCDSTASCLQNCTCSRGTKSEGGLCIDVCGNGVVTGAEQCDSTYGCTAQCKCASGTVSENDRCIDVCGNAVVTGTEQCDGGSFCDKCKCVDGYKPTSPLSTSCEVIPAEFVPRVNPSLDCLEVLDNNIARLYFSYENIDDFEQTIPYGKYNAFNPSSYGTSRPTVFSAGQSLTFPLSPYVTNITLSPSASSVSWLLGSFNLTVELSGITSLQCPKAPSIEIELSTYANLTDDNVQQIIDNIADKYDIDPSRINVTVTVKSTTQPPTYVLIVTINNPTNATAKDANSVFTDLFNDLKENSDDTKQDLTKGLEDIEPVIKQINTRPTGVEVRGQPTNSGEFTPISATLGGAHRGLDRMTLGLFLVSAVVALML